MDEQDNITKDVTEEMTAAATGSALKADNKAPKKPQNRLKRILILAAVFILFLIVTNPSILPFWPKAWKTTMLNLWSGVFGDVSEVIKTVTVNWVSLFKIVIIVLLMIIITNLVKLLVEKLNPKSNKMKSALSMIDSVVTYVATAVGIIWSLNAIGINLSTIFASVGIIALIIGFAAESLIEDVITGVFLVFEDDFNVGDIIEIDGFRGTVTSIGVRTTCIQNPGGNVKIMNNSDIRNVLNRSKTTTATTVDIPIGYDADIEQAEKVILKAIDELYAANPDVFAEKPRYAGVQELAGSSVNLRIIAVVEDKNVFTAPRVLNRGIKIALDKAGISIPFQQIVVHNAGDM